MSGVITSLPPLVEQPPGSTSSNPAGLPGVTYVAAILNLPQTWTALQTFLPGMIALNGSGGTSQVLRQSTPSGVVTVGQLSYADISGGVPASVLPTPTTITLGGVFSKAAVASNFLTQVGTDGVIAAAQPDFTNISGSASAAQMPALTGDITTTAGTVATSIGATKVTSVMLNANVFSTAHSWAGQQTFVAPILGTPASGTATNLTGTASGLTAGNVTTNANLTGDVTSVGNASTIAANAVSNSKLATMAAFTFKGNNTSGSAAPTDIDIHALTLKASPASTDEVMISDQAAAGAWKKVTVSTLASAGSVASIAGNTGAFTLGIGLTNAVNDLRVSLTTASNTLGADAAISNSVYTDGPSMAQGTSGTWFVSGTVTVLDTAGATQMKFKLWDGTTVIASASIATAAANFTDTVTLSGIITSPAANIRISCTSTAAGATSTFKFNASGNSKDCSINGHRIG